MDIRFRVAAKLKLHRIAIKVNPKVATVAGEVAAVTDCCTIISIVPNKKKKHGSKKKNGSKINVSAYRVRCEPPPP